MNDNQMNNNQTRDIMNKFIRHKIASGLATATIDSYCFALRDFWQWLFRNKIKNIDSSVIEDYFIYLRGKRYSQTTLRDKYAVLHCFFNFCMANGFMQENPLKIKKPVIKEKARCFSDEEITKIMASFSDRHTFCQIRDYAVICILLATGIRRNELLNIQGIQGNSFVVKGKGKERFVPISTSLKAVLKEYIAARNAIACCPFLIVGRHGRQLTKDGMRAIFTRLSTKTGIGGKRFSAHTFRHYFATASLRNGIDLASLQKILGHSNIQTTELYLNWTDETTAAANEKSNPLNAFKIFF